MKLVLRLNLAFALAMLAVFSTLNFQLSTAFAQGTAFTYQGQLQAGNGPANGIYNLQFTLYTNLTGGTPVAGPATTDGVAVSNGLITATIDFGGAVWNGTSNWLQIAVETNGAGSFSMLSPRQILTPVPYGIYAEVAGALQGLSVQQNANSPNLIGGSSANYVTNGVYGATIGGGGANLGGFIYSNSITGDWGTIGGGAQNTAGATATTIAGGDGNNASGLYATIGGGEINTASGNFGTIAGGYNNFATTYATAVVAGYDNDATGPGAFIGGGGYGGILGNGSQVQSTDGAIVGGMANSIGPTGNYGFIGGGAYNSALLYDVICGGLSNNVSGNYSFIGGGQQNTNASPFSVISGGIQNTIVAGNAAIIGGGDENGIGSDAYEAGILSGVLNNIGANAGQTSIVGGWGNTNSATQSIIGSGTLNIVEPGANQAAIVAGEGNTNYGSLCFIGAGYENNIEPGYAAMLGSGYQNFIGTNAFEATIAGGWTNSIGVSDDQATIGGGQNNQIQNGGIYGFIGGGQQNTISNTDHATISGGDGNKAGGGSATVGGGYENVASGADATVPGGYENIASGAGSFAAGARAWATNNDAFVWADDSAATFSFTNSQFVARSENGFVFLTTSQAEPTSYVFGSAGVALLPGATAWSTISDRNAKKNFARVNGQAILEKLAAIPIERWNYKWEKDGDVPNIGPMAQDFKHAFYPGRNDTSISTLEFDGVELAAIQGLNEKLEEQTHEKDGEIAELKKQNDLLARRLNQLEQAVKTLAERN